MSSPSELSLTEVLWTGTYTKAVVHLSTRGNTRLFYWTSLAITVGIQNLASWNQRLMLFKTGCHLNSAAPHLSFCAFLNTLRFAEKPNKQGGTYNLKTHFTSHVASVWLFMCKKQYKIPVVNFVFLNCSQRNLGRPPPDLNYSGISRRRAARECRLA